MITISESLVKMNHQTKLVKASNVLSTITGTSKNDILAQLMRANAEEEEELFIPATADVMNLNFSRVTAAGGIADRAISLAVVNTITIEKMIIRTNEESTEEEMVTMIALNVASMFEEYLKALRKITTGRPIKARIEHHTIRYIGNNWPVSKKEDPISFMANLATEGDLYNAFMNLDPDTINKRGIFKSMVTTKDISDFVIYVKSISNITKMGVDQFESYVMADNVMKHWYNTVRL